MHSDDLQKIIIKIPNSHTKNIKIVSIFKRGNGDLNKIFFLGNRVNSKL